MPWHKHSLPVAEAYRGPEWMRREVGHEEIPAEKLVDFNLSLVDL